MEIERHGLCNINPGSTLLLKTKSLVKMVGNRNINFN